MDSDELTVALAVAKEAGDVLRHYNRGDLRIETKSSAIDLVTQADRAAEAVILAGLRAHFPAHGILAEESGQVQNGAQTWVVDPIDGTTNFAHGHPHFCVSIGLCEGKTPRLGVIHDPLRNETFVGETGHGAWLITADGVRQPLTVADTDALENALVGTGFAYDRHTGGRTNIDEFVGLLGSVRGIRRCGSAALDLAYLAAGRLDGFWEFKLSPWDTGAGAAILAEAGGRMSRVDGGPWDPWSDSIVAANPRLIDTLMVALRR